MLDFSKR